MLSHTLECVPCVPSRAMGVCKLHEQYENYLAVGLERLQVESVESEEALWEVQAQPALVAPRHCTVKTLC